MYTVIWRYAVKPTQVEAFESAYGPGGDWAQLFASQPGYVETRLYRELTPAPSYLTIDVWHSQASYDAFLETHRAEYDALDERCASLTDDEERVAAVES